MTDQIEIIDSKDKRWQYALDQCPYDFYALPSYCDVEAQRMGGSAIALYISKENKILLIPLIKRNLPSKIVNEEHQNWFDATSPYGYSGIVTNILENDIAGYLEEHKDMCLKTLQENRICNIFVRLHPIFNDYDNLPWGCFRKHGEVYWIDLTKSHEELNKMVRPRFRSYINASIKNGAKVRIDEQFSHYDTFIQMYYNTMEDVGAENWYFFSKDYFYQLKEALGEKLKLVLVEVDGTVFAAGLYTECNKIVEYHLSGKHKSEEWAHLTKLMMVYVRDWAKSRGNVIFHLGGGVGATQSSPLTFFKSGFTKNTRIFCSWRVISEESVYQSLLENWKEKTQTEPEPITGYFPAYRKGLV